MTPEIRKLIAEMHQYCARQQAAGRRMSISYLAKLTVNDGKLVTRLEAGGECLPRTMAKIRAYMAANPPAARPPSPDERREPERLERLAS